MSCLRTVDFIIACKCDGMCICLCVKIHIIWCSLCFAAGSSAAPGNGVWLKRRVPALREGRHAISRNVSVLQPL